MVGKGGLYVGLGWIGWTLRVDFGGYGVCYGAHGWMVNSGWVKWMMGGWWVKMDDGWMGG